MNIAQVDSAISKASRLMNEDYMAYLDGINAMTNGGKKSGGRRKGGNDLAYLDQQVFGRSSSKSNSYAPQQQIQENAPQRQFSSSALQESFAQTPPISGYSFPGAETMGATQSGYQPGASLLTEQRTQQQFVQQPQQVYQPQYQAQSSSIDYNMIKYLISEAIKENMAAIKQGMLTEGAVAGIRMSGGNKIQFLDSKGNVYEGQLVLKKKKQ